MPAGAKQAAEKVWFMVAFLENGAGAKAPLSHFQQLAARLKSGPDTKPVRITFWGVFPQPVKPTHILGHFRPD
jgi:hypothetical protein